MPHFIIDSRRMLWVKTFHILFVIAWVAGIFYMPRIMVHYAEGKSEGEDVRRLVTMLRKLFGFSSVMGLLAIGFGFWLWLGWWLETGDWIYAKIGLVLFLIAYQVQCYRYLLLMEANVLIRGSIYFRIFNEAALLLLIPILALAVIKPF